MCIRDSSRTTPLGPFLPPGAVPGKLCRRYPTPIDGASRKACLLYTSDAADERSSVDLGGRRIIKKKKREKTDGVRARFKKKK